MLDTIATYAWENLQILIVRSFTKLSISSSINLMCVTMYLSGACYNYIEYSRRMYTIEYNLILSNYNTFVRVLNSKFK